MQGKGVIRFFLVLMTFVTVVQYLYFLPTNKVEKDAERYAEAVSATIEDEAESRKVYKARRASYLDSMSTEEIVKVPLIKSYTYQELKSQQLALGLDLKGGMSVVLQVDLQDFIKSLANNSNDPTFQQALEEAAKAQTSAQSDFVTLFSDAFRRLADGEKSLASIFSRAQSLDINVSTSDGEVTRLIRESANNTVQLTFQRLKERIDKLGVTQPNVSLDAARDLIIVELPGIDNPERARNFLQAAAKLEFWNTYRFNDQELAGAFDEANRLLTRIEGETSTPQEQEMTILRDTVYETDSLGNQKFVRVDFDTIAGSELGIAEGPLFNALIVNRTGEYGMAILGRAEKNERKTVDNYLQREEIRRLFPANLEFKWSKDPARDYTTGEMTDQYELYAIKKEQGSDEAPLTGETVTFASSDPNPQTGEVEVTLRMNREGTRQWARLTRNAADAGNREIAILLDDEVVSAPRVNEPILNGSSSISGTFTIQEGEDLANILQIGKLPAETRIIQESLVGPTLGAKNIRDSIIALAGGFILVLAFMVLYYGGAGIVSIIALLLNLFFIFGALASVGTVLTLPGIAGIVLTIGMAVDANVIIFERVREELREGKSLLMSISDGFKNSYSAIIDANVTTILTAIVLAYFGLGPIKGFAVVLIIGVLSSLFTAVLVGRMIIEWWTKDNRNITFWTSISKNAFSNLNINWLGGRRIAYIISLSIISVGLVSFFLRGFDLGVDFEGGRTYNIEFVADYQVNAEDLRSQLTDVFEGEQPIVKAVDTDNTYSITTSYLINDADRGTDSLVMRRLYEGADALVGGNLNYDEFKAPDGIGTHVTSSSKVGPTIADDIQSSAYYASIFALLAIFLYIFIRFSKWQYSMGAVAALFHDVLVVLGVFSLLHGILPFSMEVDQYFIAAILTVIGYSINDTVVVFDRIREFAGIYVKKSKDEVINMAINSTVSRTVITSLTTLFVVLILFLFGGASIRGFAFALLIGILVGTYSSIFIATPVMSDLSGEFNERKSEGGPGSGKRFSKALEKAK